MRSVDVTRPHYLGYAGRGNAAPGLTQKMAFFDCGGIRLMLGMAEKPEFDHPGSIVYFWVEDIQDANAVLLSRAVHFEAKPHLVARRMIMTCGWRSCVTSTRTCWL